MGRRSISNAFSVSTIQDGVSPAVIEVSLATLLYDADANGASTSAQEFAVTYTLKVGNETILEQNVTSVTIQTPNGVSIKQNTKTNSGCTFVVAKDASPSGVIGITMTTTKNGNLYEPHTAITVAPNVRGENGERGKVGRFFYYGGVFDLQNTKPFPINDAQAPYFEHTETITTQSGTTTIKRYHVFNYETNGSYTMAQMWAISSDWNNKPWEAMTDDFKYLITEAIFADVAHLGSAIISRDWKLSQYGKIYDTNGDEHIIDSTNTWNSGTHTYTKDDAYTLFDSDYPNSSKPSANNFVPNYAEDWLSGATYQQEAYVAGSIYASSIGTKFKTITFSGSNNDYYVGLNQSTLLTEIDGLWNFMFVPVASSSNITVYLPVNHYSYIGQRVIVYSSSCGFGGGQEVKVCSAKIIPPENGDSHLPELRELVGISTSPHNGTSPLPMNAYTPIQEISFVNGFVELICLPPYDGRGEIRDQDIVCDWGVVNIGTNFYRLEEFNNN